jgi:radical SAM-linked protein
MADPNQAVQYPLIIRFRKAGLMRFVGHLDWQAMQQSMLIRAGFKLALGEGPTKKLRMKTSPPTPVGVESDCEVTYVLLNELVYPEESRRRLQIECPEGIEILKVRDAGMLARKNPFAAIEATEYSVDFGPDLAPETRDSIMRMMSGFIGGQAPEEVDEKTARQVWGKIIDVRNDGEKLNILAHQLEGDTFHAARCAEYLVQNLGLPHYPIFRKVDYYRLKPSKRALYR